MTTDSTPEYTPSMEKVRAVWCAFSEYGGLVDRPHSGLWEDRLAEFDRWLAAHDAEVARKALLAAADDFARASAAESTPTS